MATRGQPFTLSERMAYAEEQLRNLPRLPGAVVPTAIPPAVVGGPGGLHEEMWAAASASASASPVGTAKSTTFAALTWNALVATGGGPPSIDPDSTVDLVIAAPGLHLLSLANRSLDVVPAGRSVSINVEINRGFTTVGHVFLPVAGTFDDGTPQQDQRTVAVHLLEGDRLRVGVWNTALPSTLTINVAVGLSRLGASVAPLLGFSVLV